MKRLLVLLLLASCDASDPTPWVPTYDPDRVTPVPSTEFCPLLARATCAVLRPCCEGTLFSYDENKCRAAERAQCEARRSKSMELGLAYDDLQAGRCVQGTAVLMRGCRIFNDDPIVADVQEACREVFHGRRRLGEACDGKNPVECAPPELGVRVQCSGICRTLPLAKGGEICQSLDGRVVQCQAGLVCEGADVKRCTAYVHPLGAACVIGPAPVGIIGGERCGADAFCDDSKGTPVCTALPTSGQPCAVAGCRTPYRCDIDKSGNQLCTDAKDLGAACNDNKECASRFCVGNVLKLCAPAPPGRPIADESQAVSDPAGYLARIAAACSGVIPEGFGGLVSLPEIPRDK